jgi:heme-degrading monooxygenase HmoA
MRGRRQGRSVSQPLSSIEAEGQDREFWAMNPRTTRNCRDLSAVAWPTEGAWREWVEGEKGRKAHEGVRTERRAR